MYKFKQILLGSLSIAICSLFLLSIIITPFFISSASAADSGCCISSANPPTACTNVVQSSCTTPANTWMAGKQCSTAAPFSCVAIAPTSTAGATSAPIFLDSPLGRTKNLFDLLANIIQALLGITGSVALLMIIYAGFLLLTAGGKEEQITKGKDIIIWAVVGIAVILGSYVILQVVFATLNGVA